MLGLGRVCLQRCMQTRLPWALRQASAKRDFGSFRRTQSLFQVSEGRAFADEDVHILSLHMPSILDSTEGRVTKWLKKEGESVHPGSSICRVQLDDMEIEMESPFRGVLADIKVGEYISVPPEEELCVVCDSQEAYMTYFERRRVATLEAGRAEAAAADLLEIAADAGAGGASGGDSSDEGRSSSSSAAVQCMRALKRLHGEGLLDAMDEDAYARLLELARKGDKELLTAYKASFEDGLLGAESFDAAFFIDNCKALGGA